MRADWERGYVDFVSARLARWHRQAYLLAGDAHRADDIVQQTCTNLFVRWRRASSTDNPDSLRKRHAGQGVPQRTPPGMGDAG